MQLERGRAKVRVDSCSTHAYGALKAVRLESASSKYRLVGTPPIEVGQGNRVSCGLRGEGYDP